MPPDTSIVPSDTRTRRDRDFRLVESLRLGEAHATEELVATYGSRARRLATRTTGSMQDAEEVVQDALWAVVRKIGSFRGEAAFGSWLYRIVANAASQKRRGQRRRRAELSLDDVLPFFNEAGRHVGAVANSSARLEDRSAQPDLRMTLSSAIEELPADLRTVLVLRDLEGRSNQEIADALQITIPNVKSRAHRGRLSLRRRLGGAGPGAG
jgi:RNA polymerase sigma-70 factor (ECF subfamily)